MVDVTKKESLLSMQQAADMYGVHIKTIYGWIRRGLESAKVGGKRFTTKEAVQYFSIQGGVARRIVKRETTGIDTTRDAAFLRELTERFGMKLS